MNKAKTILTFDTSLGECSAALWCDGKLAATQREERRNQQTQRIIPMIEAVLHDAGMALSAVEAMGITVGPGSFTGIRIGIAVARGIALARQIPLYGVSSLELLAWQGLRHFPQAKIFQVAIQAYRGEVYWQSFHYHQKMQAMHPAQAVLHSEITAHLSCEPDAVMISDSEELGGTDFFGKPVFAIRREGMDTEGRECMLIHDRPEEGLFQADLKQKRSFRSSLMFPDIFPMVVLKPQADALAEYLALHALNLAEYPAQPVYIRPPDAKPQPVVC
jgi:tRNA threonylcarbamoyl adenosine modification protein YeaZ